MNSFDEFKSKVADSVLRAVSPPVATRVYRIGSIVFVALIAGQVIYLGGTMFAEAIRPGIRLAAEMAGF